MDNFLQDVDWHISQLEKGTKDTEARETREDWLQRAKESEEKISSRPDAVECNGHRWSEYDF